MENISTLPTPGHSAPPLVLLQGKEQQQGLCYCCFLIEAVRLAGGDVLKDGTPWPLSSSSLPVQRKQETGSDALAVRVLVVPPGHVVDHSVAYISRGISWTTTPQLLMVRIVLLHRIRDVNNLILIVIIIIISVFFFFFFINIIINNNNIIVVLVVVIIISVVVSSSSSS
jgi:hypothetical protein